MQAAGAILADGARILLRWMCRGGVCRLRFGKRRRAPNSHPTYTMLVVGDPRVSLCVVRTDLLIIDLKFDHNGR